MEILLAATIQQRRQARKLSERSLEPPSSKSLFIRAGACICFITAAVALLEVGATAKTSVTDAHMASMTLSIGHNLQGEPR